MKIKVLFVDFLNPEVLTLEKAFNHSGVELFIREAHDFGILTQELQTHQFDALFVRYRGSSLPDNKSILTKVMDLCQPKPVIVIMDSEWENAFAKLTEAPFIRMYSINSFDDYVLDLLQNISKRTENKPGTKFSKQFHFRLHREDEFYTRLFDTLYDGIFVRNWNGAITRVNQAMLDLLGYERDDDLVGKPFVDIFCEFDKKRAIENGDKRLTGEIPWNEPIEYSFLKNDGSCIPVEVSSAPMQDETGQYFAWVVTCRDITIRKQIENSLREERDRFQNYLDVAGIIILTTDMDGNVSLINHAGCEILGYEAAEILGKNYLSTIIPEAFQDGLRSWFNQLKQGKVDIERGYVEGLVVTKTGEERIILWRDRKLNDVNGKMIGLISSGIDATEKIRVSQALLRSEERLRMVLEVTSDGIWDRNFRTGEIYYSPAWKSMLGYVDNELQNTNDEWESRIHVRDKPEVLYELSELLSGRNEQLNISYRIKHKDGSWRWIRSRGKVVDWIEAGKPGRVLGTHQDITAQKQAEEAIKLEQNLFRGGPVVASKWLWGKGNASLVYLSKNIDHFGYDNEDFLNGRLGFKDFVHPDDHERIIGEIRSFIQSDSPSCEITFRSLKPDEKTRWAYNYLTVSREVEPGVSELYIYTIDVTDLKQTEEAFRILVEQSLQELYIFSEDHFVFLNPRAELMSGYKLADVQNLSLEELFGHVDFADFGNVNQILNLIGDKKQPIRLEFQMMQKNGVFRDVETMIATTEFKGKPATQFAVLDITERKMAERELQLSLEKEKELSEMRSSFITMTSHEFRTPLSTILSSAELMEHYDSSWSDEKRSLHLRRIQEAAKHINTMLGKILVIGRAEAGKVLPKPVQIDLLDFCRELIEEMQIADLHKHEIEFFIQGNIRPIYSDKMLLRQVLENLLSNALKFSPINTKITLRVDFQLDQVLYEISDEGCGIPDKDLDKIFTPFHRAENVQNIPGTGLGLTIVKKSLELMRGNVQLTNPKKKGTCFTVCIPYGSIPDEQNKSQMSG
jgi:PAS domain S-box-containing protein